MAGGGINKVIIIGNLGRDPEVSYTPQGTAKALLNIATTDSWKDKTTGEKKERTEWHRVVVWDKLGEICGKYLSKGRQVYIEGRLQSRSYDDKEGVKRYITEIVAQDVQFLGGGNRDNADGGGRSSYSGGGAPRGGDFGGGPGPQGGDDDIPF
jgi:single-strand DNA-binding protein